MKKGYLERLNNYSYSLTNKGQKIALSLKDKVKISKLRTNPKINEKKVPEFLEINGKKNIKMKLLGC